MGHRSGGDRPGADRQLGFDCWKTVGTEANATTGCFSGLPLFDSLPSWGGSPISALRELFLAAGKPVGLTGVARHMEAETGGLALSLT